MTNEELRHDIVKLCNLLKEKRRDEEKIKEILMRHEDIYLKFSQLDSTHRENELLSPLRETFRKYPHYMIETNPIIENISYETIIPLYEALRREDPLTEAESILLIRYMVSCTRMNLAIHLTDSIYQRGCQNIKDATLEGLCGLSTDSIVFACKEISSLVHYRDMWDFLPTAGHSFCFLKIPTYTDLNIIEKKYIIDCTYRQFFQIQYCSKGRLYRDSIPDIGYFVYQNKEKVLFAQNLLQNGFFIVNENNLCSYFEPFLIRKDPNHYHFATNQYENQIPYRGNDYLNMLEKDCISHDVYEENRMLQENLYPHYFEKQEVFLLYKKAKELKLI